MTIFVCVTDLRISARIGINIDEFDRFQPLNVSVEVMLNVPHVADISESIDYRLIASIAEDLALHHIGLIETFAFRLATRCLAYEHAETVEVVIEKPEALIVGVAKTKVRLSRAADVSG